MIYIIYRKKLTWSFPALPNFFSSEDVTTGRCPKNFFVMNDSGDGKDIPGERPGSQTEGGEGPSRAPAAHGVGDGSPWNPPESTMESMESTMESTMELVVARLCQPFSCRTLPIFIFPQEPFTEFRFRPRPPSGVSLRAEERRGISLRTTEPGGISFSSP